MSKLELIQAYVGGEIGRRDFVRGLTVLGVSSAAALAYAHRLAPSAVAAGGGAPGGGFVMRAQQADEDYPSTISQPELVQALQILIEIDQLLLERVDAFIGRFSDEEVGSVAGAAVLDRLQEARNRIQERLDAETALLDQVSVAPSGVAARKVSLRAQTQIPDDPQESYRYLADLLDTQAALYVLVVPGTPDPEARQTMMSMALPVARQAAFARILAGLEATASSFEEGITPDEADDQVEATVSS
jgi:hypothetical protein